MPPAALTLSSTCLRGNAVAGQGLPIDFDAEDRLPGDLLGTHIGSPGNLEDDPEDFLRLGFEGRQVVAVELDPDVGTDARDHLVDPHLDRLGVDSPHAGELFGQLGPSR